MWLFVTLFIVILGSMIGGLKRINRAKHNPSSTAPVIIIKQPRRRRGLLGSIFKAMTEASEYAQRQRRETQRDIDRLEEAARRSQKENEKSFRRQQERLGNY